MNENHTTAPESETQATPDRLDDLEQIITNGKAAFLEVGEALGEIRDNKLYKAKYSSFEAYLEERWQISRAQGYRLIAGFKVAKMSPIGDKLKNLHQALSEKRLNSIPPSLSYQLRKFKTLITRWKKEVDPAVFDNLLREVEKTVKGYLHPETEKEAA